MFYNYSPQRVTKTLDRKPLYVSSSEITSMRVPTGEHVHEVLHCLIPYTEFLDKFCHKQNNNYVLYHGTNSIEAVISILGEGFLTSINSKDFNQGIAKLGSGLCTTGDYQHAMLYGDNIFALQVLPNHATRVLFANNISAQLRGKLELEVASKGCLDVNDLLYKYYHVDVIIASDIQPLNSIDYEVLIQNSQVFINPNTGKMLESTFEKCLRNLFGGKYIDAAEISHQIRAAANVVLIYRRICEAGDVKPIIAREKLRMGICKSSKANLLDLAVYLDMLHHELMRDILSPREILSLMMKARPANVMPVTPQTFNSFNSDIKSLLTKVEITSEMALKSIALVLQSILSYLSTVDWDNIQYGEYGFSGWLLHILWFPPLEGRKIAETLVVNFPQKMTDLEFSSSQQALEHIKDLLPIELFHRLEQALLALRPRIASFQYS